MLMYFTSSVCITGSLLIAVGSEDCSITLVSVTDTACEYTQYVHICVCIVEDKLVN